MNKIKISSLVIAMLMVLSISFGASASTISTPGGGGTSSLELTVAASTFSVTVPTSLTINVSEDGTITTATNAKIINNGQGAVKVSNISVTGAGGWSPVAYSTDMGGEKVGSKKFGFMINNSETDSTGSFIFNPINFPKLDGANPTDSDELPITYGAKVPAQKVAVTGDKIADIVFTVVWDD